jgi:uncharacterized repeat protein (TIGR01451 family)
MLVFLGRLWQLVKPYRARLVMGVVAGIISGLVSPLLIATIMFVYGAVFPSDNSSNLYSLTNNAVAWPPITLAGSSSTNFTVSLGGATNDLISDVKIKASTSPAANVSMFVSGPPNVGAGNKSIYTIVVTNSGSLIASNVVVSANFPTNLVFNTSPDVQLPIRKMPGFLQRWFVSARTALGTHTLHAHPWALAALIGAIPCIMLLRGLFSYLNVYFLQWVSTRAVTDLRTKLFSHLLNLSAGFYTENSSGQPFTRNERHGRAAGHLEQRHECRCPRSDHIGEHDGFSAFAAA